MTEPPCFPVAPMTVMIFLEAIVIVVDGVPRGYSAVTRALVYVRDLFRGLSGSE